MRPRRFTYGMAQGFMHLVSDTEGPAQATERTAICLGAQPRAPASSDEDVWRSVTCTAFAVDGLPPGVKLRSGPVQLPRTTSLSLRTMLEPRSEFAWANVRASDT